MATLTPFKVKSLTVSGNTSLTQVNATSLGLTTALAIGANVLFSLSSIGVGNSTVNTALSSLSLTFASNSTVNSTLTANNLTIPKVDAVAVNTSTLGLGNSTVNSIYTSLSLVFASNSTVNSSLTANNLSIPTANVTTLGVTNVFAGVVNATSIGFGNSTANVLVNSVGVYINGTALTSGASIGGANTQVLFNDSGAAGGYAGLVFNKTSNTLTVANTLTVNGPTNIAGAITANSTLVTVGAITSAGQITSNTSLVTVGGIVYLNAAGNRYLQYDGTNYQLANTAAGLVVQGGVVYLKTDGSRYINYDGTNYNLSGANLYAPNFAVSSDERLKTNIQKTSGMGKLVDSIEPKLFQRTDTENADEQHLGFIAQDFIDKIPHVLDTDVNGMYAIKHMPIIAAVWAALRETRNEVKTLKKKVAALSKPALNT